MTQIDKYSKYLLQYIFLMRLNSPAGLLLLMLPCIWSLTLASHSIPSMNLLVIFILGSLITRTLGCIVNDIFDAKFDKQVSRTKNRPIASGQITVLHASILAIILAIIAFYLLTFLSIKSIIIAFIAAKLIFIYPLTKRFFPFPQLFLGIVFNLGVLMAWVEVKGSINLSAIILYLGAVFWTLAYDTIYAFQDINDDKKLGLRSMAIVIEKRPKFYIESFYKISFSFLMVAPLIQNINYIFFVYSFVLFALLQWQTKTLDLGNPLDCKKKFQSNVLFGIIYELFLILSVIN